MGLKRLLGVMGFALLLGCEDLPSVVVAAATPAAASPSVSPSPSVGPITPASSIVTAAPTVAPTASPMVTAAPPTTQPTPTPTPFRATPTPRPTPTPTASPTPTPLPTGPLTGTIVPLYGDPEGSAWGAIIAGAHRHPTVPVRVVVNPADGPGTVAKPEYVDGIARLQEAGITPLGYIATGYTAKRLTEIETEIRAWRRLYPGVKGVFFDEMAHDAGKEPYYVEAALDARIAGLSVSVGNPGTDPGPSFDRLLDTILIYEAAGLPDLAGARFSTGERKRFGMIPYAVGAYDEAWVRQAAPNVGWLYLTPDGIGTDNPWDTLTDYWERLLATLEAIHLGN